MRFESTLQKNGYANIPICIRRELGLAENDVIVFTISYDKKNEKTVTISKKEW